MDGIERIEEALRELPEGDPVTLAMRFHDGEQRVWVKSLQLRRDRDIEEQLGEHLEKQRAQSGTYELRLRHAGRFVKQATLTVHVRPVEQVAPRVAPEVAPQVADSGATGGAMGGDQLELEIGRRVVREAIDAHLAGPEEDDDGEDDDSDDEPTRLGFFEELLRSDKVKEGVGELLAGAGELLKELGRSRAASVGEPRQAGPGPRPAGGGGRVVGVSFGSKKESA